MAGQLTQKERMLLQDQLRHEEVCIWKYQSHAGRASSPAVKTMFNEIAKDEQNHYNTINQLLGGSGGGLGSGHGSGFGGGTASRQQQPSAFGVEAGSEVDPVTARETTGRGQGMQEQDMKSPAAGSEDAFLLSDLLTVEKFISGAYDTAIFESNDPQVRQSLLHIQKDEQKHGERIFRHMQQSGMYEMQG